MTVPDYQLLMLPLLRLLGDGEEYTTDQYIQSLAAHFELSVEDQRDMLPSGRQSTLRNRASWAATYMSKAGLLERTARSRIRITDRGLRVLADNPATIDIGFLSRFPEFVEFRQRSPRQDSTATTAALNLENLASAESLSPDEMLESSYQRLRESLAHDVLERVKTAPPAFFEQLDIDLLVAMGYGGSRSDAGQAIGGSGDGGIDGIIKEDRLGLDFVYLQAKRWEGTVSRPIIQGFAGSLEGQRARKGVFITTSRFSRDAEDYVKRIEKRIVLIDGEQLAQYMLDFGIGVTEVATYKVQRVDLDYFGQG